VVPTPFLIKRIIQKRAFYIAHVSTHSLSSQKTKKPAAGNQKISSWKWYLGAREAILDGDRAKNILNSVKGIEIHMSADLRWAFFLFLILFWFCYYQYCGY
jgi:hypothetical protein